MTLANIFGRRFALATVALACLTTTAAAQADPFTVSYLDGGTWPGSEPNFEGIFAQGFSPMLGATPNPGLTAGDLVPLDRFEVYKAGFEDSSTNIQCVILSNIYMDLATLTTSSPELVGTSSNTVATTLGLTEGQAIQFNFDSLMLTYGNDYAAIFVNEELNGDLTPVRVSAWTADYVETSPGSGTYVPESNYGTNTQYQYTTSNFINVQDIGGIIFEYFTAFGDAGDADFTAYFDLPEGLLGDYNGNDEIDAADYTVWRDAMTAGSTSLANDPTPGTVDESDFIYWRDHFGTVLGGGSAAGVGAAVVPEPSSLALLSFLAVSLLCWARGIRAVARP
jgi:hypothetical protein